MTTFDPGVPNPVHELAARVARLEEFQAKVDAVLHRAGIYKMVGESPARVQPPRPAVPAVPPTAATMATPLAPPSAPPVAPSSVQPIALGSKLMADRKASAALPAALPNDAPKTNAAAGVDAFSIERLIGGRWLAAAGAVIVVIGVGLFLKLAYDLGWFGGLSPAAKCGMGALFGAVLMAAGECVRRRVNALGSVGLFAAGLGTIYASAYAAHATYGLVGPTETMTLLVGCVGLGIVIGSLTDLVAVAVLSLLGGYLTPFMLHKPDAAPWFLPVYLLSLLAVALVLSGWKCVRLPWFSLLRTVAWWGTLLLGGFWTLGRGDDHWVIGLCFLSAVWSATHLERFFSAGRMDRATPLPVKRSIGGASFADARLLAGSLSTTAWCALLAIVVLDTSNIAPAWYSPAALCASTLPLGFLFAGHRRVFTEVPRTTLEKLGVGMVIQSGALLVAAIALAFTGWMQVAAGLSLGVAAVAVGRWINSRALDYYGIAVLAFASGTLFGIIALDWPGFSDRNYPTMIQGLAATEWSWRLLLTASAWFIAAGLMLIRNPAPAPARAIFSAAAGVVGLVLVFAHPSTADSSLTNYWTFIGVVLMVTAPMLPRLRLEVIGYAVLSLASLWLVKMLVAGFTTGSPGLHFGLASTEWAIPAFLLAGAWMNAAWREGRQDRSNAPVFAIAFLAAAIGALLIAFVHAHTELGSLCVYWGAIGLCAAAAPESIRRLRAREMSLGVLGAAIMTWVFAFPFKGWNKSDELLLLHPGLLAALGLGAAWLFAARRVARAIMDREPRAFVRAAAWGIAGLLVFVSTSFEVARAAARLTQDSAVQRSAVSIYWGVFAVALLLIGFLSRSARTRYVGLALINIAALKTVIVDLSGAPPAWRIASFIGLGLLMIGTAVGYAKLAAKVGRMHSEPDESDGGAVEVELAEKAEA